MRWERIGKFTTKVNTWNPCVEKPNDFFDYIDLSSIDKDNKTIDYDAIQRIKGIEAPSRARQKVNVGDILVSTVRPNLNGVAIVEQELEGATASTGYCVIRVDKNLDSRYLFYWFLTPAFIDEMVNKSTGASYPAVSDKIIKESKIPLPPLATQKKIAAILDEADKLRQLNKQLIAKYEALTQSLFLDMFGKVLTNSKKFDFPELKELCVVNQGMQIAINKRFTEPGENRFKYITVAFLNGRKTPEFIENPRESVVCYEDDVLMTRTGNTGQVVTNVHGVFHNNFFKVDYDRTKLNKTYFTAFLGNPNIRLELIKRASTTTIPDLNHGQFYSLKIPLPPISLQNLFAERIQSIDAQKAQAQQALVKSEALFNSLLQNAFKGEVVE